MEIELTSENYNKIINGSDKPVLIEFGAEWCSHCRRIEPVIREIAEDKADELTVCRVDTDAEPELSGSFNVRGIPAIFVMKHGKVVNKSVGYQSKSEILKLIDEK